MTSVSTIGILTSGGDAPGMNAAIRAVTLVGHSLGVKVIGISHGYRGILEKHFTELSDERVHLLFREGGTILHSSRCLEFHQKEVRDKARGILQEQGIDGLIVIGGNGSLAGALALCDPNEANGWVPKLIGIPASIDNDIGLTGMCIGVDTAINTIVEACDKISDTATAHDRTFIVEVMGRDSGYLAMTSGVASGADLVLFPESHKSTEDIVESAFQTIVKGRRGASGSTLIIKAEGVALATHALKEELERKLKNSSDSTLSAIEIRVTVLGHVVRGGRPSAFDRLLGSRLGNVAVRALCSGRTSKMTAWITTIQIPESIGERSQTDHSCWLVDLQEALIETEKLLCGDSVLAQWRSAMLEGLEEVVTR